MKGLKEQGPRAEGPECSIVVPFFNEEETVEELCNRIRGVMNSLGKSYEMVFVDDGSRDRTGEILRSLALKDDRITVIRLRRNFGQTAALAAGFDYARGQVIISMDGDLQHDPAEIPKFLSKLEEGYDIVSGWRSERVDNFFSRRLPSAAANWIMAKLSGVPLHDFGTTFKAYRREILENVNLYGELHRFIPALASVQGIEVAEIPIKNIIRPHGKSKYGLDRTIRVMLDLITVKFLLGYLHRPLQFFGLIGLVCFAAGFFIGVYVLWEKLFYGLSITEEHAPLTGLGILLIALSVVFISTGLLGEVLTRLYYEGQGKKIYFIREVVRQKSLPEGRK